VVVECSFNNVWLPVYIVFVADGQVLLFLFGWIRYSFNYSWTLTVIISSLVGTLPLLRWELGTTCDTSRLFDAIIIKYFYIYIHIKFDNWRRDLNLNISFRNARKH